MCIQLKNGNENTLEKISEIRNRFMSAAIEDLPELLERYGSDERSGVAGICRQYRSKLLEYEKELERIDGMKSFERQYADCTYICGMDEVGRGPFAGPVVAAAVILPKDCRIPYINDSKKLSEKKREELYDEILSQAVSYGIGSVPPNKIDEINILQATYEAMRQAIGNLTVKPDIILTDAVKIPGISVPQVPIIKGDAKSYTIAAASIIAKVTRDRLMVAYEQVFPGYGFAENKGYGSKQHIDAIKRLGPTPIHRMSFIKNYLD